MTPEDAIGSGKASEDVLEQFAARDRVLLKLGYERVMLAPRHVRWNHPRLGFEEQTPDGKWWFSTY